MAVAMINLPVLISDTQKEKKNRVRWTGKLHFRVFSRQIKLFHDPPANKRWVFMLQLLPKNLHLSGVLWLWNWDYRRTGTCAHARRQVLVFLPAHACTSTSVCLFVPTIETLKLELRNSVYIKHIMG